MFKKSCGIEYLENLKTLQSVVKYFLLCVTSFMDAPLRRSSFTTKSVIDVVVSARRNHRGLQITKDSSVDSATLNDQFKNLCDKMQ